MIEKIRKKIDREEFDYLMLLDCLKEYARPRDKITNLINKGQIIRVKKGLYIFGQDYRKRPYSREIIANLIYGPSYISQDYALSYYGLIPERVETLTCVTTGRTRKFDTPVGMFTYLMIPLEAFQVGMARIELQDGGSFLIATPEKALVDKIYLDRKVGIRSQKELREYLLSNLRIDPQRLIDLDADSITHITNDYRSLKVRLLGAIVKRMKNQESETVYA